ncbi:MAG TPA: DNA/RNA non-specific endonuclease, partial [Gemmatimonadaceae bacterium]|nr:DNA/RNA non-specific endonuclease [Gemmatimonadaceae bacterium]
MRTRIRNAALVALALVVGSCSENSITGPSTGTMVRSPSTVNAVALPPVRISEFHYDNPGTDAGESIEISFPTGTNLNGWTVVLYNGSSTVRAPYGTTPVNLGTLTPTACTTRSVVVLTYLSNGIQNGSGTATGIDPDGFALVNNNGVVVEFLSYEGSFTAASGVAAGLTSTDIGIRELGAAPEAAAAPFWSLKRDGLGVWSGPSAGNFSVCNDENEPPPPQVVDTVIVTPASATINVGATQGFTATAYDEADAPIAGTTFTWTSTNTAVATVNSNGTATGVTAGTAMIIAAAPNGVADTSSLVVEAAPPPPLPETRFSELHYDNFGTDANESIEIEGVAGASLAGWKIVLYNGNGGVVYNTKELSGTFPSQCDGRGVLVFTYTTDGIQNGAPDAMALINPSDQVVEFLSYEGVVVATAGPALGMTSTDIGVSQTSTTVGLTLQRNNSGVWEPPAAHSLGACYGQTPPPPPSSISFSGRLPTDPALPVGFEDQIFGTLRDGNGVVVPTTFTWTSETPAIASIDEDGVMRALSAGTAILRATATDGTTATYSLPTVVGVASTTAMYEGNAEFGEPTDADASDDFIVRRAQFTSSFNKNRGTPNWVSYNLEASHFGPEDRCDCFTFDPQLPSDFTSYTTADYTGAGTFHGYGIDRGHLTRSADRTNGNLDNATTYYFTNIIPQAADNNQGPWAIMENFLGNRARDDNKEVYVIAGVAGSKGTIKNEGKIVIPAKTWKVAIILPRDQGIESIDDYTDVELVAVIMPNDPGIRNVDWNTYKTTVDAVEALSGYDLLALLRDDIEIAVESGTAPPVAAVDGPYSLAEGGMVNVSGALSTDSDGDVLTYEWSFGDGNTGTGVSSSNTYAQDGSYTVRLIVTDPLGLKDTASTTATVGNVTPVVAAFAGATLLPGETYSASGSFTDPGADSWSATVNYGDGGGATSLSLT